MNKYAIAILLILAQVFATGLKAQTSFEQSERDVFHPSSTQRNVARSTDVVMLALPAAALTSVLVQQDWKGLVQGLEAAGTTAAATLILKYAVKERRPDGSDMHSFPSGHSSVAFASAAFMQRRYGWAWGAPAYAAAAYVGWGRVFSKKHHVWDVVAGAAFGAASAYIFTTPFARRHDLTLSPVSDGNSIGMYASLSF